MDHKGYVMGGMSFLLVLPAIMLFMVFLDLTQEGIKDNSLTLESGTTLHTAKDLEANIPVVGSEVLRDAADDVIETGKPLSNSRKTVKDNLQIKMDQLSLSYRKNTGLDVECNITSVDSAADPFQVEINSSVCVRRGQVVHKEDLCQDISLIDPKFPMPNPLPFVKCKNYGGSKIINNRISFGSSLTDYLKARGIVNNQEYENATTGYIIKKCPYDPYITHGKNNIITLKNCIENGYFHESSDGSCFLCRMEGKGICPHYGIETFIIPRISNNTTLTSAPSSIDHVIFNDTPPGTGTYPGTGIIYHSDGLNYFKIFLDNSHRAKYGLPLF